MLSKASFRIRTAVRRPTPLGLTWRTFTSSHKPLSAAATVGQQHRKKRTIAVLGGGISGLTSAYRLSRHLPAESHEIVLLEKSDRLGGWIHSERIPLPSLQDAHGNLGFSSRPASALIEKGPRSIRPAGYSGMVMLQLLQSLHLLDRLLTVPKTAASAKNRFIYYPDKLVKLPSSLSSLLLAIIRIPFLRSILPSAIAELVKPSRFQRPKSESKTEKQRLQNREYLQDESVDSFVSRRFGKSLAENLVSAVIHGIYAGDTRRLSVRSVLPFLWDSERAHGSVLRGMLMSTKWNSRFRPLSDSEATTKLDKEQKLKHVEQELGQELIQKFKAVSVYSFPDGVQEIVDALEKHLLAQPNVTIRMREGAQSLTAGKGTGAVEIRTTSGETLSVDRVVSSIPSPQLASTLSEEDRASLPHLAFNPAANVGVVNVVITPPSASASDSNNALLPVEGFGYLIPRSTPNNHDGILGVVFDSDSLPTQDTSDAGTKPIKLTVMMGGSHWTCLETLPTKEEMKRRAVDALHNHLGISKSLLQDPTQTTILPTLQKDCIPWYLVGHSTRMAHLHTALRNHPTWSQTLSLVGASYTGVSLNDCVAYATETVDRIVTAEMEGSEQIVTGLEAFEIPPSSSSSSIEHGEKPASYAQAEKVTTRIIAEEKQSHSQGLFGPTSTKPSSSTTSTSSLSSGTMRFSLARGIHTSARRAFSTSTFSFSNTPPPPPSSSSGSSSASSIPSSSSHAKKPTKSLERILLDSIKASGPMPVSTYMRTCLLDPMQGYYSTSNTSSPSSSSSASSSVGEEREVLGSRGDFITSPEISQVFGELIAIFYIARWQSIGRPSSTRLIELGPGKGTLLADMLRTFGTFPIFLHTIRKIHLVETSPGLMELQLSAITAVLEKFGKRVVDADTRDPKADEIVVEWFPTIDMVPIEGDKFSILTAHEFFDALPTHVFEKHADGSFRELLVGIKPKSSITVLRPGQADLRGQNGEEKEELGFVLSPTPTPWTQMLVAGNPRFKHLAAGQRVEVSPESWGVARRAGELVAGRQAGRPKSPILGGANASNQSQSQSETETETVTETEAELAEESLRLSTPSLGGVGLIIDYGDDRWFGSSFRGFSKHQLVSVFTSPGSVDLTTNVDFHHLKTAIATTDAQYLGPLDQADFLVGMGLQMRTERLLKDGGKEGEKVGEERNQRIMQAANRLIDENGMGTQYKFLAIKAAPTASPSGAHATNTGSKGDAKEEEEKLKDALLYPFELE